MVKRGDEPDGSGAVRALLEQRDGLILGLCNRFRAFIKLGLVLYSKCRRADGEATTLTLNTRQARFPHV